MYKFGFVKENSQVHFKKTLWLNMLDKQDQNGQGIQKHMGCPFIDRHMPLRQQVSLGDSISTMLPYMQNPEHIGNIVFIFWVPCKTYIPREKDDKDVRDLFRIDAGLNRRIPSSINFACQTHT